jgi:Domain of unknown function (DUF4190)/GYF domain 2
MNIWFYSEGDQQAGPVSDAELHALVTAGRILPTTLVWRDGMAKWLEFSQLSVQGGIPAGHPPSVVDYGALYPTSSGYAIASLICGIAGLVTCIGLLSIPAVICGHMALHQIKNSPRIVAGRGMALAGLICGYLALLMVGAGLAMLILGIARTH